MVILHHATTIREGYQAEVFAHEAVSHVVAVGICFFFPVLRVNVSHIGPSEILALHAGSVTRP